ncbi:hypothetical protein ACWD04_10950 [Streptomyces sp. NPDC002911]
MSDAPAPETRPRKKPEPARLRLLAATERRFHADGISATGIDTITAEAALLLEGAMTRAGLEGAGTRLQQARMMAANLLYRL